MRLEVGDHIEKNEVNRTTLREVMRFLRQKLSKISAKIDTFPIFEEKSHSRDNTKYIAPFFRLPTQVVLLCDLTC